MQCETCKKEFRSYNPNPRFCSRRCKGDADIAKVDHLKIAQLYISGMTQDEVSRSMECGRKTVSNSLKRQGVKSRKAAKRNQWGDKNTKWKGDAATYFPKHRRVERRFGKPKKCCLCGTENPSLWYDWANLTGNYNDPNDYKRMCRKCHRKYDAKRRIQCTIS